jgi:PAS domain S-box-containing protein
MQIQIFFSMLIGTCAITLALSFYAFRQHNVLGVQFFKFFTLAESLLVLAEAISMVSNTQQNALFWFDLRVVFLAVTPILWLFFIIRYYQMQSWLTKWSTVALCIIPLATIIIQRLPFTTQLWVEHDVSFYQLETFWLVDTSSRVPGIWYFVHTCFSFILTLGCILVICSDLFKSHKVNSWISILLLTSSLVYLGVGLYPAFIPLIRPSLNPIVLGIGVGALLQIIAIFTLDFLKPERENKQVINEESIKSQERESLNLLILAFVILAVSIASIGFLSYKNFQRQYRTQVEEQLTSISLMKVADIQKWRNERLSDAQEFYQNDSFSLFIENYLQDTNNTTTKKIIQNWLISFASHQEYEKVFFIDTSEEHIITADDSNVKLGTSLKREISQVLSSGKMTFEDIQRDSDNSSVFLSIIIPIYSTSTHDPLGSMVIKIDPQVYLYPLISRWPVPSDTAETAIVRKENNQVVYLSNLRFEPNAILKKFIDLTETNRPSVKAVTGSVGIVEGVNYRGKQVIADVRPIPDSPWFLVSRIDQDEVSTPLLERERLSWILYSTLILASGIGLNLIWRQQKMRSLITNKKVQNEILERDRKLKEAQELAHLGFWYWDVNSGDVEWSEEVYKIFQIQQKDFKPQIDSILALSPWPEDQNRDKELIDRAIKTRQPGMYEQKFLRPDKSIGYYSSTFLGIFDENDNLSAIVGSVMDITDRTIKEQALKVSENRFRNLFEHAAVGVAIINTKTGQHLDINQKYCDFLGYSKQEMLSRTFQSVTKEEYIKPTVMNNRKLISGKIKEYSLEKQYIRKNGEIVWGELSASSLWEQEEKPEIYMHIVVVKDSTEQKMAELALRESEKRFRETIANLDEGYYSTTIDGTLIDNNDAYNRILGFPEHQILKGMRIPDFWQNIEDRQKYVDDLKANGSITAYQINAKKIDGKKINVLASAHIVEDENNSPIKIDGVFLDITSRILQEEQLLASQTELQKLLKQAELSRKALLTIIEDQKLAQEEINQLNKTLEERVNQRTEQLKASNEELESFAYSISHDLRAPLRAIDGYSRILEQDYAKVLDNEGLRLLGIVRNSTRNLDRLITDLLSLSRVGRSELKIENLDMNSMVESIYQELTTPEMQEKINFSIQNLPEGYGDSTLIRHVWMNLVSNAIKYSAPKEKPQIEIYGFSDSEQSIYTIKDNGVGFNPDYKDKLFGLFQRLHKASDFEGTGVGLAIVYRIVTRHEGQVWGTGEMNNGAEFSFTLPKQRKLNE